MKKLLSLKNRNYTKFYNIYKMIPVICGLLTLVGGLIFGILDAIEEITGIGEAGLFAVIIWSIIGAVGALIVLFIMSITMSPTIVRTDATVGILNALKCNNGTSSIYNEESGNGNAREDEFNNGDSKENCGKIRNSCANVCKKIIDCFKNLPKTTKIVISIIISLIIVAFLFIYIAMGKGLGLR